MDPKQIVIDADGRRMTLEKFLEASAIRVQVAKEQLEKRLRDLSGENLPGDLVHQFLLHNNVKIRHVGVFGASVSKDWFDGANYIHTGGMSEDGKDYWISAHIWIKGSEIRYKEEEGFDCELGVETKGAKVDTLADPKFFNRLLKWLKR